MRKLAIAAAALAMTAPALAQRQPAPPPLTGIDLLRSEFVATASSDTVMFGGSSATLSPPAKEILMRQAYWLRRHPGVIVSVEGHADTGDTRDHALAVAARRAIEVRDFLILYGVPPAQLTATSWGKERVAVAGTSEAALAANRRVQTVLVR